MALHVFNLLDQDLPFVYNSTLNPGYYPYVTFSNWLVLGLSLFGFVWYSGRWQCHSSSERFTVALTAMFVLFHWTVQAPFHVETRFGWPSLIVLYSVAAVTALQVWKIR